MIEVPFIPNMKALDLVVSDKKVFSCFPYISLFKTFDPGAGPFWSEGHNLNKLGRGPLGDAKYQQSRLLGHMVSDKKILKVSSRKSILASVT